jgi:hypothetical protein
VMARQKAARPDMDHKVVVCDHHSSRLGNFAGSGTRNEADWAMVTRNGEPGSCWNGALAVLAVASVHKVVGSSASSSATVGGGSRTT